MKFDEIKEIARRHNLKVGKSTKRDLIRSIQHAEGFEQCFNTNQSAECGQHSCAWRDDCC